MNMKTSTRKNLSGGGINMGLRIQPKPEDLIWDATALPADVAAGKVFYNNDGRQMGNAQTVEVMHITLTKDINLGDITVGNSAILEDVNGIEIIENDRSTENFWSHPTTTYSPNYKIRNCMFDKSGINKHLAGFSVDNGAFQSIGYYPERYTGAHFSTMSGHDINFVYNGTKVDRVTAGGYSPLDVACILHLYFI